MSVPLEAVVSRPRAHINSLPTEILAMIFLSITVPLWFIDGIRVWTEADMPANTGEARYLVRVCRRWHAIAISTPGLWTWLDIRSCRQLSLLPRMIARSGNAKLFVHLWLESGDMDVLPRPRVLHSMQRGQWNPGLDALVQNMHRIVHIYMLVLNWEDAQLIFDRLRTAAAPLLRYFMCSVESPGTVRVPRDIFMGVVPQLHFLSLFEVLPEDWGSPLFTSVKDCDLSSTKVTAAHQALRVRQSLRPPSMDDLALLLDAALQLRALNVRHFAFSLGDAPIVLRNRRQHVVEHIGLRLPCGTEGFLQLAAATDLSSVAFLIISPLSPTSTAQLLSHLHGEVDLSISSLPPDDVGQYVSSKPFYDDAYDVGHWRIRAHDALGHSRVLKLERHTLRSTNALGIACAPIFSQVTRLLLVAGQWPQASEPLSRVCLPAVSQLVIQYTVERSLLGGPHESHIYCGIEPPKLCEPLRLCPLRGTKLILPALRELVLYADCHSSRLLKCLPLQATADRIHSIAQHVSLDGPNHPCIRLIDVIPSDADAEVALTSLSQGYVLEKSIPNVSIRSRWSSKAYWWHKSGYESYYGEY